MRYRVETVETTVITREQWYEAESENEARTLAEGDDWREWSEVDRTTSASIEFIEEA